MPASNSTQNEPSTLDRRTFIVGVVASVVAVPGCLDVRSSNSGPQERTFTVTITTEEGEPAGTIEGADIEDVAQIHVGDTVTFTFTNDTEQPVGVHDHATDAEIMIDPGMEQRIEFEATESMIGRQEIEAWFPDETDSETNDGHTADATPIVIVEVRPQGS